jgi:membrane protein
MVVSTLILRIDQFQRRKPWLSVPLAVVKRFGESGSGALAATIAYYGFFSLFPLLLVLTSVAGNVLSDRPDLQERLVGTALAQFPVIGTQIRADIGSIDGSRAAVVVGIVLALWAGLGGVRAAQLAIDTVWDVPRKVRRGTPASIAMAFVMLTVLGVSVIVGAALASVPAMGSGGLGAVAAVAGSAALNIAVFALAYRVLLSASVRWRWVMPGAAFGGIGWTVLLSFGGWIVADRIASSSDVYGTFAMVIGLLAWIYLGAQLTLLGAELNVVLAHHLWPRSLHGDHTRADERALRRSAMQEERKEEEIVDVTFEDPDRGEGPTREVVRDDVETNVSDATRP